MSSFGFRPHFEVPLELGPKEAQEQVVRRIRECGHACELRCHPGFVCVRIPADERHFWSPRLNLSLEAEAEGRTIVEGVYGPNANVWSLFLYGYLIIGSLGLFAGVLGYSQTVLDLKPWGLWLFGVALGLALLLYLGAQFGQKLGSQQTFRLHQLIEDALECRLDLH